MKRCLLVIPVIISLLVVLPAGCCAPQAEVTPRAPPNLYVIAASSKSVVHVGEWFSIAVTVENRSQGKAENVHIYMELSALGYALAESCNYQMAGIAPGGLKISLGDVFPGDTKTINIECKATNKAQYEPQTVTETFSYDYCGSAGRIAAYSILISFSTGAVAFAQQMSLLPS